MAPISGIRRSLSALSFVDDTNTITEGAMEEEVLTNVQVEPIKWSGVLVVAGVELRPSKLL